jgi:hypothetical protein
MATFDQLSAEQRAILELVLKQGQSYNQLGDMLDLPTSRVRELARDSLVRLSPVSAAAVADDWRGQLADYLLNQQAGPEGTATRGHLRRSEAARGWARSVLDSLDQFYDEKNMPVIPEGESGADSEPPRKRREPREKRARREPRERADAESGRELSPAAREVVRRRRLAGLGALAALLLLVAVLFWPIGLLGGDDDSEPAADATTTAATDEQARLVGQLPLAPVESLEASNDAQGIAAVAERGGERQLIVQAKLPKNARDEAYQVWLYNSDEDAVSLGAQVADPQGNFQGAGPLPDDFERYKFIDVSREPIQGPEAHSGDSVLRGALDQLAPVPETEQGAGQGDTTTPAPE